MTEELDTQDVAQETDQTEEEPVDTETQADPEETQHGMTKEQLDFIDQRNASHFGRIVANQIDEKVMPMLQQRLDQPASPRPQTDVPGDDINNELQEMIFSGDITGAFEKMNSMKNNAANAASQKRTVETKQAITSLSDKPYYKDIYTEVEKITQQHLNAGYPPKAAAEMAYEKAKGSHLEGLLSSGNSGLGMSAGGRQVPRKGKTTLPPQFRAAADRDIEAGIFKNDEEYIAGLSVDIRAKYGM